VTEIDNPQDEKGKAIDNFGVLIGMDIITRGDFTVTNFEGKTIMSFRMPSLDKTVSRPEIGLHDLPCKQYEKIRKNSSGTRGYHCRVFAGRYDLS
jgi:hypothetical protein